MSDRREADHVDVGVVFVHGIGESLANETLIDWTRALLDVINRDRAIDKQIAPEDVSLHEPSASLLITADGVTARFVESWWANLFRQPSYLRLLLWSFKALPTALVAQFDEVYRRTMLNYRSATGGWAASPWMIYDFVALFAGLLLVPVALLMLSLLVLLRFVPFLRGAVEVIQGVLSSYVGDSLVFMEDRVRLSGIVNKVRSDIESTRARCDRCIVLAHSQGAAIAHEALKGIARTDVPVEFVSFGSGLRKLTELREYQRKGRYLAYGSAAAAALAAASIAAYGLNNAPNIVWHAISLFGLSIVFCFLVLALRILYEQARTKLAGRAASSRLSRVYNRVGLVLIVVLALVVYAGLFVPNSMVDLYALVLCPVALGGAFTLLMEWRHIVGRQTTESGQHEIERDRWQKYKLNVARWYDLYANYDPVPNGPLMDYPQHGNELYEPRSIVNRMSVIRDHVTYWSNRAGFVEPLCGLIFKNAPLPEHRRGLHACEPWEKVDGIGTLLCVLLVALLLIDWRPDLIPSARDALVAVIPDFDLRHWSLSWIQVPIDVISFAFGPFAGLVVLWAGRSAMRRLALRIRARP